MAKKKEHAPGIPKPEIRPVREVSPDGPNEDWVLGVEFHQAKRAGDHYDLRLLDPKTGDAHSWVLPKAEWPAPGERKQVIPTFTHTADYALRTGKWKIDDPLYGAGKVEKIDLEPVELIRADNRVVRFNRYGPGQRVEELSIIRGINGADILHNHTLADRLWIPEKPKYKDARVEDLDPADDKEVWQAKIDGAHVVVHLPAAGKPIRVLSVRKSKKNGGAIEHTFRIDDWHQLKTPSGLGGTVLRAELYGADADGKPLKPQEIAGLLNQSVWGARLAKEERGIKLKLAPFDVVKWNGRLAEYAPYRLKLDWLKEIKSELGSDSIELPDTAMSKAEKQRMLKRIKSGTHPQTAEGVVVRRLEDASPPVRAKITEEREGTIVGFTPGKGRLEGKGVGGFVVKDDRTGKTSVVGTGLTQKLREAAKKNPKLFRGAKVRVEVQQVFPSGKYRAPRFKAFHLDKNDPERLEGLSKYAAGVLDRLLKSVEKGGVASGLAKSVVDSTKTEAQMYRDNPALVGATALFASPAILSPLGRLWSGAAADKAEANFRKRGKRRPVSLEDLDRAAKDMGLSLKAVQLKSKRETSAYAPAKYIESLGLEPLFNSGKKIGKRGKATGMVLVTDKTPVEVGLHEVGHAHRDVHRNPAAKFVETIPPSMLQGAAVSSHVISRLSHNPLYSGLGALLGTAVVVDRLSDEYHASKAALEQLRRDGVSEKDYRQAKKDLDQAYKSYSRWSAGIIAAHAAALAGNTIFAKVMQKVK